jgi:hypothetical protein
MNALFINNRMKPAVLSSLLAAMFSLSAHAALYTFNYTDSGPIPRGGPVFSAEHAITGIEPSITSLELILTFNDSTSLSGDSSGIQGHLILGTGGSSPFVNFYPVATRAGILSQQIYDVIFSGTAGSPDTGFNGLNPNNTWGLVLWDNHPAGGNENALLGWSLDINPVPEPVNVALGIFAGVFLVVLVARSRPVRNRVQRWRVAAVRWVDAV